jgi:putative ABC transport system ATP-binding protein
MVAISAPTESENVAVSLRSVKKVYTAGENKVEVLHDANLSVLRGEFATICGASGSGKTTLLNLVGGIDKPTTGNVCVFGEDLSQKDEDYLSAFRCQKIGYVFQSYNLVSTLTVAENIAFPMEWTEKPTKEIEDRVNELLRNLGLQHRKNHFPAQLSGGEQQRVALARALANDPPMLLVDEPTGNLDSASSQKVIDILRMLKAEGKTIIVSTHDNRIVQLADRVFCLDNGRVGE